MSTKTNNDTPCKECVFAKYVGITQTGCRANRLQLFRKTNAKIIEAFDEEKEFYVIVDKHCAFFRPSRWKYSRDRFANKLAQVRKEIEIKYQAIVFANDSKDDIVRTLNDLCNQTIPPQHITVIRPIECSIKPRGFVDIVQSYGIPWRVENITNPETPTGLMIDFILSVKPHPYYAVFNAGCSIPLDTFKTLNNKMVDELYPLVILAPNSQGNGLIVSSTLHQILQGNQDMGVVQKLEQMQNLPSETYGIDDAIQVEIKPIAVKPITELCPNFPQ